MSDIKYIYSLSCPETNDIRYIGKTNNIAKRYNKHIYISNNPTTYSQCWIKSLILRGIKPIIEIVEECSSEDVNFNEVFYINLFRSWGFNLTNLEGGGTLKKEVSDITKKKLSVANIGKKQSTETKLKRSITSKETWKSEDLRRVQRERTIILNKLGVTGTKDKPSKKKGLSFCGDRRKVSFSLKQYYKNNVHHNKIIFPNMSEVIEDYNNRIISLVEIANKYNVAKTTITKVMKENNIPLRNGGQKYIDEDILKDLRINKKLPIKKISTMLNCSEANIVKFIKKWDLQTRR